MYDMRGDCKGVRLPNIHYNMPVSLCQMEQMLNNTFDLWNNSAQSAGDVLYGSKVCRYLSNNL